MFFQETTPDTSGYMIAGYAIAFLIMGLYVASIYLRSRNLSRDMNTLEEIEEATPPARATPVTPSPQPAFPSGNHKSPKPVTKKARRK